MSGGDLALTALDLRTIADGLDSLAASGVQVEDFRVHGYRVQVQRQDSQMDGVWYVVAGLTREQR